eukprot:365535-Chlamydomonas_euryale.AAC.2
MQHVQLVRLWTLTLDTEAACTAGNTDSAHQACCAPPMDSAWTPTPPRAASPHASCHQTSKDACCPVAWPHVCPLREFGSSSRSNLQRASMCGVSGCHAGTHTSRRRRQVLLQGSICCHGPLWCWLELQGSAIIGERIMCEACHDGA